MNKNFAVAATFLAAPLATAAFYACHCGDPGSDVGAAGATPNRGGRTERNPPVSPPSGAEPDRGNPPTVAKLSRGMEVLS